MELPHDRGEGAEDNGDHGGGQAGSVQTPCGTGSLRRFGGGRSSGADHIAHDTANAACLPIRGVIA